MARVEVRHKGLTDPGAKAKPVREVVPEGKYSAMLHEVKGGATRSHMAKITCEFIVLGRVDEDTGEVNKGDKFTSRRVFQDFILERNEEYADLSDRWRYELVMLLDATGCPYDDDGFDDNDLKGKAVLITVKHREGDKKDDDGNPLIFPNVTLIEDPEPVSEDDLV